MVFQGFKKVQKIRSKLHPEPTDTSREQNNLCFFRIPKNRYFKVPVDSSTCPPPYLSPAKSNYFLNRTNRTDRFLSLVWSVSTDVKGASRNEWFPRKSAITNNPYPCAIEGWDLKKYLEKQSKFNKIQISEMIRRS